MEKVGRIFRSFEEAEEADRLFYASLTPQERIKIFLNLLELRTLIPQNGAAQGLERTARVSKLELR